MEVECSFYVAMTNLAITAVMMLSTICILSGGFDELAGAPESAWFDDVTSSSVPPVEFKFKTRGSACNFSTVNGENLCTVDWTARIASIIYACTHPKTHETARTKRGGVGGRQLLLPLAVGCLELYLVFLRANKWGFGT